MTGRGKELLEGAYKIATPSDNVTYYRDFAQSYDAEFADGLGYQTPQLIADYFLSKFDQDTPLADIGCGTGLVASALDGRAGVIDGFDISPEMIDQATQKNLYRECFSVDLTQDTNAFQGQYGGLISAGTFTHGHLGPDALEQMLPILRKNGLAAITVSVGHFDNLDFQSAFDRMTQTQKITAPEMRTVSIYNRSGHEHSSDQAHLIAFRRL